MGKISTKELFNRFFEEDSNKSIVTMRAQVDREEVYEYEKKIGKELIDMNVDELFGMLKTFTYSKHGIKFPILHSSYDQMAYIYRSIFNYYIENIENVEAIKNPFYDKRMRGREALKVLLADREAFTKEAFDNIISNIRQNLENDRADYMECILLLYYNGFANSEEIAILTDDMIDKKNKIVQLPGKKICLSERCYELLEKVHNMETLAGWRTDYIMKSWRGKYFKYPIFPKSEDSFDDRSLEDIGSMINRCVSMQINVKLNTKIGYRLIYTLGFYEYIVERCGEKRAKELITSYKISDDVKQLMNYAKDYNFRIDSAAHLKKALRPFINVEDLE